MPETLTKPRSTTQVPGLFACPAEVFVGDHLMHRDLAAHAAKVTPSTVAMWASRGWKDPATGERRKLEVADRDWRGRPLYRYLDVMRAEQQTRRRGRQRDTAKWAELDVNSSGMPHVC